MTDDMTPIATGITAAVKIPGDWDEAKLAKLARELAMDIKEKLTVLANYGLNEAQFARIADTPWFKRCYEAAIVDWNAAGKVHDRIKIEAATTLEQALPLLAARMGDKSEVLSSAVQVAQLLAKISGLGERDPAAGAAVGEKFTITINLGADTQRVEVGETARPVEASVGPVLIDVSASDGGVPIQQFPQGSGTN